MRVLVACEFSGVVREAFRALGHDAWSCDLLFPEDGSPYHLYGDVRKYLRGIPYKFQIVHDTPEMRQQIRDLSAKGGIHEEPDWANLLPSKIIHGAEEKPVPWDLMIAHPPCTHLAVSGSRWFPAKRENGAQQEAIEFFLQLARAPIPRIAIENPVCIMSSVWREPDQVIQPWQFGTGEVKATCLWLKGLPPLVPTKIVAGRYARVHLMPPSPDRWKERSRTDLGIAAAMAAQWSNYSDLVTLMEAPPADEEITDREMARQLGWSAA